MENNINLSIVAKLLINPSIYIVLDVISVKNHKHTMIDNCKITNFFDSVCEYADSRGIVRQRCGIELSVQSESESEHATSIDELSVRYTLVRLMSTLIQFCGERQSQSEREHASSIDEHARSILWRTHWFDFVSRTLDLL